MPSRDKNPVRAGQNDMTIRVDPPSIHRRVEDLRQRYEGRAGLALLRPIIEDEFPDQVALACSFGAESAVLLHMVASVNSATPVIFLNTGKLFDETLAYRDQLIERLGLSAVRNVSPSLDDLTAHDPGGELFQSDPDRCCFIRKVAPLTRVLGDYSVWITGRKAYQGGLRAFLPTIEAVDRRIKINPIVGWNREQVRAYFDRHDLPHHPLEADGFLSCLLYTSPSPRD